MAIDPHVAVPLVQSNDDPQTWHFAEPADILNLADPSQLTVRYGLLQSTGTQKMFFARPQVPQAGTVPSPVLRIPDAPHLADVGALLNATGLFPDLSAALAFPAPQELGLAGEGNFRIAPPPFKITAPAKTLVDFNVVQLVLDYHDRDGNATTCTVTIDPAANPRWAITLDRVSLLLVSPFGNQNDPILSVVGTVHADANSAPTLKDLRVVYGGILSLVQEIFSRLQELAKFLPGGQKVAGLQVSFSDGKLTIRDRFALPTLPLGLGEISDVSLDLGVSIQLAPKSMTFTAGIASPEKPFHWLVSPLSGNGMLQLGARIASDVKMQAGIGVGLAIDFAIVSGSASIVIAVQLDATSNPIGVMVLLTGQASVDVLDGLASASLTLTAGVGVKVSPGPLHDLTDIPPDPIDYLKQTTVTLMAEVAVGIHLSVCWLVHVDFDGSWPFSETVSGKTLAALV